MAKVLTLFLEVFKCRNKLDASCVCNLFPNQWDFYNTRTEILHKPKQGTTTRELQWLGSKIWNSLVNECNEMGNVGYRRLKFLMNHLAGISKKPANGLLASLVKLRVPHAPGMPGTFPPIPRVSDPDMHHGTCVTHIPWCMTGSLTSGFLWSRWREKRCWHSRRMRNPIFNVSDKRPIYIYIYFIWFTCCSSHVFKELSIYSYDCTGRKQASD